MEPNPAGRNTRAGDSPGFNIQVNLEETHLTAECDG